MKKMLSFLVVFSSVLFSLTFITFAQVNEGFGPHHNASGSDIFHL